MSVFRFGACVRWLGVLLPVTLARAAAAQCVVAPIEIVDHSRTSAVPYASPAEPGGRPLVTRALAYAPGQGGRPATIGEIVSASAPGTDPAAQLVARLRFYGATVDSGATVRGISAAASCTLLPSGAAPAPPERGVVIVVAAFPAVMYEGAAVELARSGLGTVVVSGGESAVRLLINLLAMRGWPVDRLVLIGHGAGGPVAQLVAMGSSAVRGIVSLDGFEALDRRRHPGLTGDPNWRPGLLRAPILHWRPAAHPDADTTHFAAAMRSPLVQVTMREVRGQQWMTAPEAALPPVPLRALVGPAGEIAQRAATEATVGFVRSLLPDARVDAGVDAAFDGDAFATQLRGTLSSAFDVTTRAALPSSAVTTDGRLDEPVWRDARTLPDATDVRVQVAEDCDHLYIAIIPTRPAPFITELFVEAGARGALLLHASASLCWTYGAADITSADCNKTEAWWWASRTNQPTDRPVAEYVIAKRAIGVARCETAAGRRIAAVTGGWGLTTTYPATIDRTRPDSWRRIP